MAEGAPKPTEIPSIDVSSLETELKNEFNVLAQSFDGFEQALIKRKAVHKDDNDRRIQKLLGDIASIEVSLGKEAKKRKETTIAMEAMFNESVTNLRESIKAPIEEKFIGIEKSIVALGESLVVIQNKVEEDRKTFPKQIEERSRVLTKQLEQFKLRFASEQIVRADREKDLLVTIRDNKHEAEMRFQAQRHTIDQKFHELDVEIAAEARVRRKEAELLHEQSIDRLLVLKKELEACNVERVRTTKEVAKALVHYAAALQDGVNIVSGSP